ncbi:MAG: YqgE/AlgH family protein [Aquihabitans sp.]
MSQAGRLLVATPLIGDPTFERTVVLLLAHGDGGAFGVVLNRPSDTGVCEVIDGWSEAVTAPSVVFIGGPVNPEEVIGLARRGGPDHNFAGLVGELGTVDLHSPPEPGEQPWPGLRMYAGAAGWSAGQLEDEIAEGAWWPVDAAPDDILTGDPARLWERVLRRQRGTTGWFANYPKDLSAN